MGWLRKLSDAKASKSRLFLWAIGLLSALALPPVYAIPVLLLVLPLWLCFHDQAQSKKQAFGIGWWFGFGHFAAGLYWISFALLVDVQQFGWLIPFALVGIAAVMGLYIGLVSVSLYVFRAKGLHKILVFAVLWTVVEFIRAYAFTGFPWNLIGYSWSFSTSMLQLASVTGIWGLSFLTVAVASLPYLFFASSRKKATLWMLTGLGLLAVVASAGALRLASATDAVVEGKKIRIVQGNIEQDLKWDPEQEWNHLDKYMKLSTSAGYETITHLIWPETAIPFMVTQYSEAQLVSLLSPIIPAQGGLISGVMRGDQTSFGTLETLWNSMVVVDKSGDVQYYDKAHLVPFGEYIPFRKWLTLPIQKITAGSVDFQEGPGPMTLHSEHFVSFSPLVCYEVIFPDTIVDQTNRPSLLINTTNDAWYGFSSGPFQHFQMARVRAIEQGIPLVRAANNGISGVIDAYGQILHHTNLQTTDIIDSAIPVALSEKTFYAAYHYRPIALIFAIFLLFSLFQNRIGRGNICSN